jgi:hypothetical protein
MQQQPGGNPPSDNWFNKYGCATIIAAAIGAIATVLTSGIFGEKIRQVFSGPSDCPINQEALILKAEKNILQEGEKITLSFEISDPKGLEFYGEWESNFRATIKPLNRSNRKNRIVEYTAPTDQKLGGRYIDTITVTVEDLPGKKCNLQKHSAIAIEGEEDDEKIVELYPPSQTPDLSPSPSPTPSSPAIEPTKFVRDYYRFVNQGIEDHRYGARSDADENFLYAYKRLSPEFQSELAPTFRKFKYDWIRCGLVYEENSIELKDKNAKEASVSVVLKLPTCHPKALYEITLKANDSGDDWKIHQAERKKYLH